MTNLSLRQLKLLATAAAAEDGAVTAEGHPKTVAALIKDGLLISVPQIDGASRLLITTAGREEIASTGADHAGADAANPADEAASDAEAPDAPPRAPLPKLSGVEEAPEGPTQTRPPKGKIAGLVALLRQPRVTTVEAIMEATGWQAHSVRGAMSGAIKKNLGLAIASDKTETGRVYRIVNAAEA